MKTLLLNKNILLLLMPVLILFSCGKDNTTSSNNSGSKDSKLPTLTAYDATDVTSTTAVLNAEVEKEGQTGVYTRGFSWGTNPEPTINDTLSINGFGPGPIDQLIEGLIPATTYYVRAYATNNNGTQYSNVVVFTTKGAEVGLEFGGGIVAYVDGSGEHGFIVSHKSIGTAAWGCVSEEIGNASGSAIGTGKTNTENILTACSEPNIAARICANYSNEGYDDWYLPSFDELMEVYKNRDILLKEDSLLFDKWYWSSTEHDDKIARFIDMKNYDPIIAGAFKNQDHQLRPIRYF